MTTIELKAEAKRQAFIRAQADKMRTAIEAEQITTYLAPAMEAKIEAKWGKKWEEMIQKAVDEKIQVALVKAGMVNLVKEEVELQCRFLRQDCEEFVHMVPEATTLDTNRYFTSVAFDNVDEHGMTEQFVDDSCEDVDPDKVVSLPKLEKL